jgi:hypothetical protein
LSDVESCARRGNARTERDASITFMSRVTLRTGFIGADGHEETVTEYLCDWPDCPNIAVHTLGVVLEIGAMSAVCEEHAAMIERRKGNDAEEP